MTTINMSIEDELAQERAINATLLSQIDKQRETIREQVETLNNQSEIIETYELEAAEMREAPTEAENSSDVPAENDPVSALFGQIQRHLSTANSGPHAILKNVLDRGPVEQAGYIASIERLAYLVQEQADTLTGLAVKSRTAQQMLGS
jgi:hypothetical protein